MNSFEFSFSHWAARLPMLAFAACLPAVAWSLPITLSASDDTTISEHINLGGPTSNHGTDLSLYSILATYSSIARFQSYPLVRFDLEAYAGTQVTGPATFSMYLQGTEFGRGSVTRQVAVHQVLTPWTGSVATFNNFGAEPGVQADDISVALDTIAVAYGGQDSVNRYVSWTLGADVVQGWIDNPMFNFGLLISNLQTPGLQDLQFGSMESTNQPTLSLSLAVPVPGSFALIVAGLLVFAQRFRPRPLAVLPQ